MTLFFQSNSLSGSGLRRTAITLGAGLAVLFVTVQNPAMAQSARDLANRIERLEQELQNLQGDTGAGAPEDMTPDAAAGVQVRGLKLEQLVEQLTGQVEETRFRLGQMSTQLRQLSNDVSYRLATLEQALGVSGAVAAGPSGGIGAGGATVASATPSRPVAASTIAEDAPLSRPVSSQPRRAPAQTVTSAQIAAGPPQNVTPESQMILRTDEQGQALPADPEALEAPPAETNAPPPSAPAPIAVPNPAPVSANPLAALPSANRVSLPDGTPKEQYEYAFSFLTRNDFGRAEAALRDFLTRHPEDPLAGNAQYWLGETYYVRGNYRQAAVEFMSGYQRYPRSNKGPDNLLKLGMSMASLGQAQGACTALGRIAKDYAEAPEQIRRTAATQRTNLKCK